ncbi:MAG: hypothetical protein ACOZIN_16265 [Myxococcota bacterium]
MQLSSLSTSLKVLVTCVVLTVVATVGLGEALIWRHNQAADGNPGLSVRDLQLAFTGGYSSLLVAQIHGPMRQHLTDAAEVGLLTSWVMNGATPEGYRQDVAALLDDRCVRCHHSSGAASFRLLDNYERARAAAMAPPTPSVARQLQVTKVHVIGVGLLCAIATFLFSASGISERIKTAAILMAFGGLAVDFGGWWLMRLDLGFAWLRPFGNACFVASILGMSAMSLVRMWSSSKGNTTS